MHLRFGRLHPPRLAEQCQRKIKRILADAGGIADLGERAAGSPSGARGRSCLSGLKPWAMPVWAVWRPPPWR
jgi:hypothetical protein